MSALRSRIEISNDRRPYFMVLRALPEASAFQSYAGHITATVDSQRNISSSVSAFFGRSAFGIKCAEDSARYSI